MIVSHLLSWLPSLAVWFSAIFYQDSKMVSGKLVYWAGIVTRLCHVIDPISCLTMDAQTRDVLKRMLTKQTLIPNIPEKKVKVISLKDIKRELDLRPAEQHPAVMLWEIPFIIIRIIHMYITTNYLYKRFCMLLKLLLNNRIIYIIHMNITTNY